jgi:predicted phosphoribosyltransferase
MTPVHVKPGLFRDRREAGRLLAEKLAAYANRPDVLVLALPRGGVPVGYEVARALSAPLDVFVVRKLGVPGYEELAMGAVATGGVRVLNDQLVERLGIPESLIDAVAARERQELARRERLYRGNRPPPDVRGRTVILVDDGLATGATMYAAIEALRQQNPARIVVAVPTASPETCEEMEIKADEVICAITPEPFHAVGRWYRDFSQTTDEEVGVLLAQRGTSEDSKTAQSPAADSPLVKALRETAYPLAGSARDYDPLISRIGEARFALLGEASHGTHEFYHERAEITKRLITTPIASTAMFAAPATTSMRWKRSPISAASRPGCGATPWWSSSSSGFGRTTTRSRRAPKRSDFTASTSTACTRR